MLKRQVLEHGFDDQVAAFEVRIGGAGCDPREHPGALFDAHAAALHALIELLLRIGFAVFRRFEGAVLKHHLNTGQGRYVGNALPHHARAEHAEALGRLHRHAPRPTRAGVDLVEAEKERADHVFRLRREHERGERARLHAQRRVQVQVQRLHGNIEDFFRRRQQTARLLHQQRRGPGDRLLNLRRGDTAAGQLVARLVPGL